MKFSFQNISWKNVSFLSLTPLLAGLGIFLHQTQGQGVSLSMLLLFWMMYIVTGMAITGGYHRLFAHKSYQTNSLVKFLYLLFGAAAFQNSAIKWSADHRRHHANVDSEQDPYNINEGFWYAHILWVFLKPNPKYSASCKDLEKQKLLILQDKFYSPIALTMGFGLPTFIGFLLGDSLGGLIYGGFLRVVVVHHCTFFINSLCHYIGKQTYTDENSARDSYAMALLTYGEGYHNFHHKFQGDYRNGLRWYHFDPTKWLIVALAAIGWAKKLVKVPDEEIFKAKLRMQHKRLVLKTKRLDPYMEEMRSRVEAAQLRWGRVRREYELFKDQLPAQRKAKIEELRFEMEKARLEFRNTYAQYKLYARYLKNDFHWESPKI